MTATDSWWLSFWEVFATIGFILVILGVVIEGVEHFKKFSKREYTRKLQIERIGWLILVAGLAMEFLGEHKAKRIADRENVRLTGEAASARESAGEAIKQASAVNKLAGDANERAASSERIAASLTQSNLNLQIRVLELAAKLEPRRITLEQMTNFNFLTERVEKIREYVDNAN